jgi:hypothetical protein
MRGAKVALIAGLTLMAFAIIVTLLRSPLSVAGTNKPSGAANEPIASTVRGATYCQGSEGLPAGTSAIRIWLDDSAGPRVKVVVSSGGHLVTSGQRGSDWIGGSVTIPVAPLNHAVSDATVCVSFPLRDGTVLVQGRKTSAASAAHDGSTRLDGKIWVDYLRPGNRSWASMAEEVARRMGLGRAPAGTWIVLLLLLLVALVCVLATRTILREAP